MSERGQSDLGKNIQNLIIEAMKAKDKIRLNALRYLKSLLLEKELAEQSLLEEDVLVRHYKKLKDGLELFREGKNEEKIKELELEIAVIKEFMPKELSENDLKALIEKIKIAQENPNMGSIMKELGPQIKGRFDGKRASQLVQEGLKS